MTQPFAPATSISYKTGKFPLSDNVFEYMSFLCIIFILTCDLDVRPFHLDDVRCVLCVAFTVHVLIFSILHLSVPQLCVTQSAHITFTWNGHCACAVSRDLSLGSKMIHIFEIPEPITYSLFHFYGVTTNSMPCYWRKIAFSHCKGYKFKCACAVSRDLCTGSPPKPHVKFF